MRDIYSLTKETYNNVGPGWWPIIDNYLPRIVALAPECMINVKEKFGALRIQVYGRIENIEEVQALLLAAQQESRTICESCGRPGKTRNKGAYIQTLCFHCLLKNRLKNSYSERNLRGKEK